MLEHIASLLTASNMKNFLVCVGMAAEFENDQSASKWYSIGGMKNIQNIGSNFNNFLIEENLLESVTALALKRVIVWQIKQEMASQKITKAMMAKRMNVTHCVINELLDVNNTTLTLNALVSAATVLGKSIRTELVDESSVT